MTAESTTAETDAAFAAFVDLCHDALTEQAQGHPEPFLALWSHTGDVTLMAAVGGYETRFAEIDSVLSRVSKTLSWDSLQAENLLTRVDGDLAVTVELEHMTRHVDDKDETMVVRATQVYQRHDGNWKVIHRHGDVLTPYSVQW
jgi:ketosteroid isomerase-like protein